MSRPDDLTSDMDNLQSIGRYKIRRRVGSGAMGQIYEAHDPVIDRRVAIKVLRAEFVARPDGSVSEIDRFRQEARAAGRLLHPNIVTLLDYGEESGTPFLAMEFVEGENLDVRLKRQGRLTMRDSVSIITQVLAGLEFAHSQGVIHRDIKPSNILLTNTGLAKIADFGIARIDASELTNAGDILGTPSYMTPEQLAGGAIDNRTDLFAVGTVLFELLSGAKPFGKNPAEIWINMDQRGPADIRQLNPNVPPGLKSVIETALSIKPDQRFASAAEFSRALAAEPIFDSEATITGNEPTVALGPLRAVPTQDTEASATFPDDESLNAIERDLAGLIGPIARTLLRRSGRTARTPDAFCETLARYIENEQDRAGFLRKCRERTRLSATAAGGRPGTAPSSKSDSGRSPSPLAIAPEMLSHLEATLTQYIGPIAQVVLRKQLVKSASLKHLYENLAAHIANERDRAAFLRSRRDS
jgi:eukaryotic-like serine/threonine-protein kinase